MFKKKYLQLLFERTVDQETQDHGNVININWRSILNQVYITGLIMIDEMNNCLKFYLREFVANNCYVRTD